MRRVTLARMASAALTLLLVATSSPAQTTAPEVAREIDTQVWRPLLDASNRFDAEEFLAVQSSGLIRVAVDRNEIYGLDRYRREMVSGFASARERGIRRKSELRFLTRAHSGELARDTGIFRSEITLASGEVQVRYAAFSMILRKEGGRWKILVDEDTARGGTITEQDFQKGTPLTAEQGS